MNDFLYEGSNNELYHWGIKKGEAKQNHKYVSRYWKNGRWNYVYNQEVLDSNSRRLNRAASSARDEAGKYNSGYYFDKDNPKRMAADKKEANARYQRLKSNAEQASKEASENRMRMSEYKKTFKYRIDRGLNYLKQYKLF